MERETLSIWAKTTVKLKKTKMSAAIWTRQSLMCPISDSLSAALVCFQHTLAIYLPGQNTLIALFRESRSGTGDFLNLFKNSSLIHDSFVSSSLKLNSLKCVEYSKCRSHARTRSTFRSIFTHKNNHRNMSVYYLSQVLTNREHVTWLHTQSLVTTYIFCSDCFLLSALWWGEQCPFWSKRGHLCKQDFMQIRIQWQIKNRPV